MLVCYIRPSSRVKSLLGGGDETCRTAFCTRAGPANDLSERLIGNDALNFLSELGVFCH